MAIVGTQQSPIWIVTKDTFYVGEQLPALPFNYHRACASVNGHDLEFKASDNLYVTFEGKRCPLLKLHFHAGNEHRIDDGSPSRLEVHLVHQVPMPKPEQLYFVVVGVLLDVETLASQALATDAQAEELPLDKWLLRHFGVDAAAYDEAKQDEPPCVEVDPNIFLPTSRVYYRYEGSLTTGSFDEVVSWVVMRDRVRIDARGLPKPELARCKQLLNRRFVLRNFELG